MSTLAHISPEAVLADGVTVGPFSVIEAGVVVGPGCVIDNGVTLKSGTVLGARVRVHANAVIGGLPQDYAFDPSLATGVEIGEGTILREGVTVNRSTKPGLPTRVGRDCMLMACSHVAHDAVLGDRVVLANGALIAGHATVGDRAFVSGGAAIHQFNRVGPGAMVAGNACITVDVPPYSIVSERNELVGLNSVGLRRAGVSRDGIAELKRAWHDVYVSGGLNVGENARDALDAGKYVGGESLVFLGFLANPGRRTGHMRPRRLDADDASV